MLVVLSPAKNLDYQTPPPSRQHSEAALLDRAQTLIDQLRALAPQDIARLMGLSDKLAQLNYDRFQAWQLPFTASSARQAIFAFKGDVYLGLDAYQFDRASLAFAQQHLRILSGLYGLLRPLDRIAPYRLEMGTRFANSGGANLYQFWGDTITEHLNQQLKKLKSPWLINLASAEYFKAVAPRQLNAEVITPVFKDWKDGKYKVISFFAKKARGRMSAYIVENRITEPESLKAFDWDGYAFKPAMSSACEWVFVRKT